MSIALEFHLNFALTLFEGKSMESKDIFKACFSLSTKDVHNKSSPQCISKSSRPIGAKLNKFDRRTVN